MIGKPPERVTLSYNSKELLMALARRLDKSMVDTLELAIRTLAADKLTAHDETVIYEKVKRARKGLV